ncbi:MAG TPA: hypothetical protein VHP11_07565 [Tepidisphaeraceae bacterium]|nr:hypothetical protein [Tepidisphaeraceae bacterium]
MAHDRAGYLHVLGPEQPQLKRQRRPRYRAHGKQQARHLGPFLGQLPVVLLSGFEVTPLDQDQQQRQANANCCEDHVKHQRDRHLQPRSRQRIHAIRSDRASGSAQPPPAL